MSFEVLFGTLVRVRRQALGLTQAQLAELALRDAGRQSEISQIERGKGGVPKDETIRSIRKVLSSISDKDIENCKLQSPEKSTKKRIRVIRITSFGQRQTPEVLDLYCRLFAEENEVDYREEDLFDIFERRNRHHRRSEMENIVLAAYADDIPVGLIFIHYFHAVRFGIISYLGVDYNVFRAVEYDSVVGSLVQRARRELLDSRKCKCLFYDLQDFSSKENRTSAGRARHFFHLLHREKFYVAQIIIPYRCPKVSMEPSMNETAGKIYIISNNPIGETMKNSTVNNILDFVYHDCYGSIYMPNQEEYEPYHKYLADLRKAILAQCGDSIPTRQPPKQI